MAYIARVRVFVSVIIVSSDIHVHAWYLWIIFLILKTNKKDRMPEKVKKGNK